MKKIFLLSFSLSLIAFAGLCTECGMFNHAEAAQTKDAQRTLDAYAPFEELIQVTPSDATEYDPPLRGCIVEVAGDLTVSTVKGDSNVTITVIAGQLVPAMIDQVRAATTATVICGR